MHQLDPRSGLAADGGPFPTRAIPNISYGLQASPNGGALNYGWFEHSTQGHLNLCAMLPKEAGDLIACSEPVMQEVSGASTVELKGRVFRSGSITAYLSNPDPAATIVYTLNGTEPTGQSAVYDAAQPILISGTTILRAKTLKSGLLPSATVTRTFFHTPSVASQRAPETQATTIRYMLVNPVVAATETAPTAVEEPYPPSGPLDPPLPLLPPIRQAHLLAGYAPAGGVLEQLEARPVIAITFPSFGISYNNNESPDTTTGAPASVEFINPANLKGNSRWQAGIAASSATSLIFPGNPVSAFSRLLLRNPATDDYAADCQQNCGDKVYIRDAWMKETQRATGALTAQRRWVHVLLNGYYWGLYDLEEFMDADFVSDHLIAAQPALTPAEKTSYAKDTLFLNYGTDNTPEPNAEASWNSVMDTATAAADSVHTYRKVNAAVANGSATVTVSLPAHGLQTGDWVTVQTAATFGGIPGAKLTTTGAAIIVNNSNSFSYAAGSIASSTASGTLASVNTSLNSPWQSVTGQLDIPSYVDYIATLSLCGKGDHATRQFRGWRHPAIADRKWRLLAWDGDGNSFIDDGLINQQILTPVDKLHPQDPFNPVSFDLVPHEYLKFHPLYQAAFDTRLRSLLSASSANPSPQVAFLQQNIMNRFDAVAGDFRLTLECEAMRWSRTDPEERMPGWRIRIKGFRDGNNGAEGPPGAAPDNNGYVRQTRSNLKQLARDARLFNDIPPPVITVTGNTATITRPGAAGRIYFSVESYEKDPRSFLIGAPEYTPPEDAARTQTIYSTDRFVSARIYGPDLNGELGWSALEVLPINQ